MAQATNYQPSNAFSKTNSQQSSVSPLLPSRTPPSVNSHMRTSSDVVDLSSRVISPTMSRSPSIASDRFSTFSGLAGAFPPGLSDVQPSPAYVAQFGATQVVSEHHHAGRRDDSSDDEDDELTDDLSFSPEALALVNAFLDHLLFAFLSAARSTSLYALRPAVTDILKNRLARDAIASADEELQELLAGGEEDEEKSAEQTAKDRRKWDLELVWKRTRLRVMVYMRLGDMEDEDEERHVKEQELFASGASHTRRFSSTAGLVSWSSAIFLTSVLEYIAEQTLQVAGGAAYSRARREVHANVKANGSNVSIGTNNNAVVVEEQDAERIALDLLLGRLWRTWRKSLRSNGRPPTPTRRRSSRTSRDGATSALSSYREYDDETHDNPTVFGAEKEIGRPAMMDQVLEAPDDEGHPEHIIASNIPLPMVDARRDVDEIEVPGLARDPDVNESEVVPNVAPALLRRRSSFTDTLVNRKAGGLAVPATSTYEGSTTAPSKPRLTRQRSMSVPTPFRRQMPSIEKMDIPGAFPEDEPEEELEQDATPERQPIEPGEESVFVNNVVADPQTAVIDPLIQMHEREPQTDIDHPIVKAHEKEESTPASHGSVAAMVAGAGAAATAATAAVGYAIHNKTSATDKPSQARDDLDEPSTIVPNGVPEPTSYESITQASHEPDQRMSIPEPRMTRPKPDSESSGESYTLGHRNDKEVVVHSRAEPPYASQPDGAIIAPVAAAPIGMARTSDLIVQSPTSPTSPSRRSPMELDSQTMNPPPSPSKRLSRTGSLLSRSGLRSGTSSPVQQLSNENRNWSPSGSLRGGQRSDTTGGVSGSQYAAANESASFIQTRKPLLGRSGSKKGALALSIPDTSVTEVQEHPALQRRAESANNNAASSLTSASIRGPEDFDMFVQSQDTVKYTLTPEKVRDGPPSFTAVRKVSKESARQTPSQDVSSADSRSGRSQTSKHVTANGVQDDTSRGDNRERRRSVSRPSPRNTSAHRKSGLMAREPRVMTDSTRDFADFIRSTGPAKEQTVYPLVSANQSSTSLNTVRATPANPAVRPQSPSYERTRSLTQTVMDNLNIPPVPNVPGNGNPSLQPRSASGVGNRNDDLINYIRDGPQEGQHRIGPNVAPFRSTMDSEQFNDWAEPSTSGARRSSKPNNNDIYRTPSLSATSSLAPSTRASENSRSALLNGSGNVMATPATVHPAHSGHPQKLSANSSMMADDMPKKRYRNKDPYAIDYSDDEDDDLLTALPRNKRKEESLADFLRDSEPPPQNGPPPNSALNRGREPSITSQISSNSDLNRGMRLPLSRGASATSLPGSSQDKSRPKLQARAASGTKNSTYRSDTSDLADFLRNSAPPPGSAPAPVIGKGPKVSVTGGGQKEKKKKSRGFFPMLRRRSSDKNGGVKTYMDMP